MPPLLNRTDRTLLWITGGVALVLVSLAVLFAPSAATDQAPSSYSASSGGAKASYLLLMRLGYDARRWEQPLDDIGSAGAATLIVADPEMATTEKERDALDAFVNAGGRLIITGDRFSRYFLKEHEMVSDVPASSWTRMTALTPSRLSRAAPEISMATSAWWRLGDAALPAYGNDGLARVVILSRGQGEIVWWAAATPLTNAGLREPGNLEFVLAALGSRERPVIFNEYVHGHSTTAISQARIAGGWLAAHGVLVALAILVTFARRSGPIIDPLVESRLSPLEFATTLGALYQRAGAATVAVDVAYRRFTYRLARRLGLSPTAPVDAIARAAGGRWGLQDESFAELLRACDAARGDADLSPARALSLTRQLADYSEQWMPERGRAERISQETRV